MNGRQAILILVDTQGSNCLGCYRPGLALRTPRLDRLAAEGVRFNRAYSCSPVCGPARSALLTGLYPHSNGVLANDLAPHLDIPTLGQRIQAAGVATGYVGKWHLDGSDYFGSGRCPSGWDPACWFDGRNYLDSLPDAAARDLSRMALGPAEIARHGITAEFTHAHRSVDRAVEFLRQHRDRDFFLVVSIDEPHHPWISPEPFVSAFEEFEFPIGAPDDPLVHKPRSQREWAQNPPPGDATLTRSGGRVALKHPRFFGCNSFTDHEVGRVVDAIGSLVPGALVVHTSDHGDMFGSHGLHGKGPCVYEEVNRVPLIVRWPGHAPRGAVSEPPVSHIDLAPTLLDFFGVAVPDLLQGRSLLPQLHRPDRRVNEFIFIEFNRFEVDHDGFGAFSPIRCVFDGRMKLAVNLLDSDELYDLAADPIEVRNLIDDPTCAADRDRLHGVLLDWMNRTRDLLRGPHWARRPWSRRSGSSWSGPTRPRPFDEAWLPKTLLYKTGRTIERYEYEKQ